MAEGGGLLNRYRVVKPYRGFESLRLRQILTYVPGRSSCGPPRYPAAFGHSMACLCQACRRLSYQFDSCVMASRSGETSLLLRYGGAISQAATSGLTPGPDMAPIPKTVQHPVQGTRDDRSLKLSRRWRSARSQTLVPSPGQACCALRYHRATAKQYCSSSSFVARHPSPLSQEARPLTGFGWPCARRRSRCCRTFVREGLAFETGGMRVLQDWLHVTHHGL